MLLLRDLQIHLSRPSEFILNKSLCCFVRQALRQVLFNQIFVGVPVAIVVHQAIKLNGFRPYQVLPTLNEITRDLIIIILMEEIGFYYSHR